MEIVYHRNEYESIYLIYVSLENSNLTILVPEDTSDEQLQAIGQKFLDSVLMESESVMNEQFAGIMVHGRLSLDILSKKIL